ncbi:MAG: DUF5615 family PIN-like protein [Actinomycetota bacterium]|nr:DUF5615 family PIN-like protein [Actinomycetota bacterium]
MNRLLLDEMLSPAIAESLRGQGIDAYGIAERPDLVGSPDPAVLELATREERVLVTCNTRDFAILDRAWMAAGRRHSGIVFVSTASFPQNRGFVGAVAAALAGLASGNALPAPGQCQFL